MDIANFEMEAGTSNPLAGAVVQAVVASLTHPNPGAVVASTSTDLNGYWALVGLSDASIYDIKVSYGGKSKWYKAYTRHNISHMYDDTTPDANRNLLHNGGQDSFIEFGTGVITLPIADPGVPNTADGWTTYLGSGDSGNLQRATGVVAPNSQASAQIIYTRSGGQAVHYRSIPSPFWQMLKGKTITESFQVFQLAASSELRAFISDGVGTTFGTVTSVVGSWQTIAVTRLIDAAATRVQAGVQTNRADTGAKTFFLDNGIADVGSVTPVFVPDVNDALILPTVARSTIVEAAPSGDSNTIAGLLNNIGHRLASIIGAVGGDWKDAVPASLTALLATLNTKVDRAGDTMTGKLTVQSTAGPSNNLFALDLTTTGTGNSGVLVRLITPNGGTTLAHVYNTVVFGVYDLNGTEAFAIPYGDPHARVYGQTIYDSGNIAAALLLLTAGNAAALGTVGPSGWARRNAGSYTGNNVGQAITVGFQARFVIITSNVGDAWFLVGISTAAVRMSTATSVGGVHIDSGNTFSVGSAVEANSSAQTYQWSAYS